MWEREQIPGFAAAQDSERVDRAISFLGLPELIAGRECAPLTPLRVEWMRAYGNPYFVGGFLTLAAKLQFLWFVSPSFKPGREEMETFLELHKAIDVDALTAGIESYLDRAYLDAPQGSDSLPYAEPAASLIYVLGQEPFNWSMEKVLTTPLAISFQLLKVREKSMGGSVVNRRSDGVSGDWLKQMLVVTEFTVKTVKEKIEKLAGEGWYPVSDISPNSTETKNEDGSVSIDVSKIASYSVSLARRTM